MNKKEVKVGICQSCYKQVIVNDNFNAVLHGDEHELCPGSNKKVSVMEDGKWFMVFQEDGMSYELIREKE